VSVTKSWNTKDGRGLERCEVFCSDVEWFGPFHVGFYYKNNSSVTANSEH